jgi:hypothetical protein
MSYTYSNEIKYADSSGLDAFGRLRTSGITSLIELKQTYSNLPLTVDQVLIGGTGATAVYSSTDSSVTMAVGLSGDCAIRQSKIRAVYQPGKSQIFEASFSNFAIQSNVIKRVGYFHSSTASPYNTGLDGFFIESNGVTGIISFQIWHSGTQVFSSPSSSWYTTDYNILSIDWAKTNLMVADFQWLGVGRVRFGIVIDGTFRLLMSHTGTNNLSEVYMQSPNQPIRYEIRSLGGSGDFEMICSQVSMEGSINSLKKSIMLDHFTSVTTPTGNTTYPLIGYRLGSGYEGINAVIESTKILNITNSGKADYMVSVELNPTLSFTPSWITTNSPIEYAIGGTQSVSSSGHRIAGFLGSGTGISTESFELFDNVLKAGSSINGTPDQVWICVISSGNNQDYRSLINIGYFD